MPRTRLASLGAGGAWGIVASAVLALVIFLFLAFLPAPEAPPPDPNAPPVAAGGLNDLGLYQRLVERVHFGEDYYAAAHEELVASNFATRSVFNWRTPFYTSTLARLPSREAAQASLAALGIVAVVLAAIWFWQMGGIVFGGLAAAAVLVNLSIIAAPEAVLFADLTAGVLVLLSASAYGIRVPIVGLIAGILALLVRELAALYVLVCVWRAWRERRWWELAAWIVALIAYAAFFAWHYQRAMAEIGPQDIAYQDNWLTFGGPAFLLATAAFNGFLALLPQWPTALILPLVFIGLAAWRGSGSERAVTAVAGYMIAFLFVGKSVNYYWGLVYTPLMMLALPWAIAGIRDLVAVLTGPRIPVEA